MIEMLGEPFFRSGLIGCCMVAAICSFLGVYVVLKRIVFVSAALAQASSAGVALALWVGLSPIHFSLFFALVGLIVFACIPFRRQIPAEGFIGFGYILASALAILFVARNPAGEARALNILFGNILTVSPRELAMLAVIFPLVALVHYLFYKEFLLVSFDYEMARALQMRADVWNLILLLTIGVTISFAIKAAGSLLVFTFLVIPAMTARLVSGGMRSMFTYSVAFGVSAAVLGLHLAVEMNLPSGPSVAATSGAFLFTMAAAALLSQRMRTARPVAVLAAVAACLVRALLA